MSVAGLVLAAGAGRRMGIPKALVEYQGRPLLDHAVTTLRQGGCAPVYAVLGARADEVTDKAASTFHAVVNDSWRSGLGSSLRAGLSAIAVECEAVVVTLVDQPAITSDCVDRVRRARLAGARVAMASYDSRRGHPVCFDRALWPQVSAMVHGDTGARDFLRANPNLITDVDCSGIGDPDDLDTPADLRRWRQQT